MNTLWQRGAFKQRGSVAVDMAFVLPVLATFVFIPLFFARAFWYYSLAQRAAIDAARFLSTVTQAEMRTPASGAGQARIAASAAWIVQAQTAAAAPALDTPRIAIACGTMRDNGIASYGSCGGAIPDTVRVQLDLHVVDRLVPARAAAFFGDDGLRPQTSVTMRYTGE